MSSKIIERLLGSRTFLGEDLGKQAFHHKQFVVCPTVQRYRDMMTIFFEVTNVMDIDEVYIVRAKLLSYEKEISVVNLVIFKMNFILRFIIK